MSAIIRPMGLPIPFWNDVERCLAASVAQGWMSPLSPTRVGGLSSSEMKELDKKHSQQWARHGWRPFGGKFLVFQGVKEDPRG